MTNPTTTYATLDDGIVCKAIPFSLDSSSAFGTAVDKVVASLGDSVEVLGLGEALSVKNSTYFALTPQCFTDFDWLVVLDSTTYSSGGPLLESKPS